MITISLILHPVTNIGPVQEQEAEETSSYDYYV